MPAKKATTTQPATAQKTTSQKTAAVKKADQSSTTASASKEAAISTMSSAEKIVISDAAPANKPAKATSGASTKTKKPARKPATPRSSASKKTTETASTTRKAGGGQKKVASETKVIAKVDVGFGNSLFIRGEGAELSWEKGILMENASGDEWFWSTKTSADLVFKLLINDEIWCQGDNITLVSGTTSESMPVF
ncbi:MAG: hypothetical protein HC808_10735 [Candidatus Competibacteraceae bacterium]|nr:hypothetical protein [Candidatus Competibacteraceae bacterium]